MIHGKLPSEGFPSLCFARRQQKNSFLSPSEVPSCCDVLFPGSNCCELVHDAAPFFSVSPHLAPPTLSPPPAVANQDEAEAISRGKPREMTAVFSRGRRCQQRSCHRALHGGAAECTCTHVAAPAHACKESSPPKRYLHLSGGSQRHLPQSLIAKDATLLLL